MLTSLQHQFAPRFGDPDKRQAYTTHMCGLCHALGDRYGLLLIPWQLSWRMWRNRHRT
jgi:hypothetical protein